MDLTIYAIKEVDNTESVFIIINNFFCKKEKELLKTRLDSVKTWYGGMAYGKKVCRQQRWYNILKNTFSPFWRNMYQRWESNDYEEWLLNLQTSLQAQLNILLKGVYETYPDIKKITFDSVLINKYQDGTNFIGPHKDDERIFGNNPTIVSLSIGETRKFIIKRVHYNKDNPKKMKLNKREQDMNKIFTLDNGTILIMAGSSQKYFSHEVEKDENCEKVRYNFTFRHHAPILT